MQNPPEVESLLIEHYKGFIYRFPNEIGIQFKLDEDISKIILNNVEHTKSLFISPLDQMVKFALKINEIIHSEDFSGQFRVTYWPISMDIHEHNSYFGVIEFEMHENEWIDIRDVAIELHCLTLVEDSDWTNEAHNEIRLQDLVSNTRRNTKIPQFSMFYHLNDVDSNGYFTVINGVRKDISIPTNVAGSVIGKHGYKLRKFEKEYEVKITRHNQKNKRQSAKFDIEGQKYNVDSVIYEMQRIITNNSFDAAITVFNTCPFEERIDLRELFKEIYDDILEVDIIGVKSCLCYVIILRNYRIKDDLYVNLVGDFELLGLESCYGTRIANLSHWVKFELVHNIIIKGNKISSQVFVSGNKCSLAINAIKMDHKQQFSFHGNLFIGRDDIILELLKNGICKIRQQENYWWNADKLQRCFFPIRAPIWDLDVVIYEDCSWATPEKEILEAQQNAMEQSRDDDISIPNIWKQVYSSNSLLESTRDDSKKIIIVNHDMFLQHGQYLSGELNSINFDKKKQLNEDLISGNEEHIDDDLINEFNGFKPGIRPYFSSNSNWYPDYKKLLQLFGWDKGIDPPFVIISSAKNTENKLQDQVENLEGRLVGPSSDFLFDERIAACTEIFRIIDIVSEYDDIILCGFDNLYVLPILELSQRWPNNRIYFASWTSSFCNNDDTKIKLNENIFFINLDPYCNYLAEERRVTFHLP